MKETFSAATTSLLFNVVMQPVLPIECTIREPLLRLTLSLFFSLSFSLLFVKGNGTFVNTVILQHHPLVVRDSDRRIDVACDYEEVQGKMRRKQVTKG